MESTSAGIYLDEAEQIARGPDRTLVQLDHWNAPAIAD